MIPPLEVLARRLKRRFDLAKRQHLKTGAASGCRDLSVSFQDDESRREITVSGEITFVPGRWMTEPFSAIFRIENLPAKLQNGSGVVDIVLVIMPLDQQPKISEGKIEVNAIPEFKGLRIDDFIEEFRKSFIKGWNKR